MFAQCKINSTDPSVKAKVYLLFIPLQDEQNYCLHDLLLLDC